MKREIVTRLQWQARDFRLGELRTTLPVVKDGDEDGEARPVSIEKIVVTSYDAESCHWHEGKCTIGRVCVTLDRSYVYRRDGYPKACDHPAIRRVHEELVRNGVVFHEYENRREFGLDTISFSFHLRSPCEGFCEEAIARVVAITDALGVQRGDLTAPEITEETFVHVPVEHALLGWKTSCGFIAYGDWLGHKMGLAERR